MGVIIGEEASIQKIIRPCKTQKEEKEEISMITISGKECVSSVREEEESIAAGANARVNEVEGEDIVVAKHVEKVEVEAEAEGKAKAGAEEAAVAQKTQKMKIERADSRHGTEGRADHGEEEDE